MTTDARARLVAAAQTLQLATAANMSLADAAGTSSNILHQFGLETKDLAHANDVLVAAANA